MAKEKDIYVVVLYDRYSGCYGSSAPMNDLETDDFMVHAHENRYDICPICLNDLFRFGHLDLDVWKAE